MIREIDPESKDRYREILPHPQNIAEIRERGRVSDTFRTKTEVHDSREDSASNAMPIRTMTFPHQ
jgi:hypothetical protein